ncbi:MAG TPA: lysophospholipid acyltransferase family protein [Sphaerochaeta sp.]|nr:lysophospholipid acyltransferase family protein [Sphaerochaeta sp.]
MKVSERIVNVALRVFFRVTCRINIEELKKVPQDGPLLLLANHTYVLDGPMLYVFLRRSNLLAMAKKELWDNKFLGWVMDLWRSIPVDRENMGRETMEACFAALDRKEILAMAPEGTRSKDECLQQGKAGIAFIAHKKDAPMVPVVILGLTSFSRNLKRLRRTPITIAVGKPFEIIQKGGRVDAATRDALSDEIMLRMAALMPEDKRGYYQGRPLEFSLTREIAEA